MDNLLALLLILYAYFATGRSCWPGLTRRGRLQRFPLAKADSIILTYSSVPQLVPYDPSGFAWAHYGRS